jgi:DNA topoisomerase-1
MCVEYGANDRRYVAVNDKPLVVVESPTKVRTINKYLGKDYNVAATVGHIKDLPAKEMGIEIEDDFKPKYRTIPGKQKVISALKKAAGNCKRHLPGTRPRPRR